MGLLRDYEPSDGTFSSTILAAVQVVEADEVAVADLVHVAVVVDLAVGLVEVQVAVGHGGVGLAVPVEAGAARALARGAVARHVVDDSVHDDPGQGRLSWRYTPQPTYITPTLLHCCTMLMKLSLLPDLLDRM